MMAMTACQFKYVLQVAKMVKNLVLEEYFQLVVLEEINVFKSIHHLKMNVKTGAPIHLALLLQKTVQVILILPLNVFLTLIALILNLETMEKLA